MSASPNPKTPPSALASRYPPPSGVATPEKTGEFSGWGIWGTLPLTLPKPIIPASLYTRGWEAPAGVARVAPQPTESAPGTRTVATVMVMMDGTNAAKRRHAPAYPSAPLAPPRPRTPRLCTHERTPGVQMRLRSRYELPQTPVSAPPAG